MKKIQLISPASWLPGLSPKRLLPLIKLCQSFDYELVYSKKIFQKQKTYLSDTDSKRLTELTKAFCDKKTDAILALRGGYGSARLLDQMDFSLIHKNFKPFFGFSDTTALQNALWTKGKIPSYTGFLACFGIEQASEKYKKSLLACLNNQPQKIKIKKITSGCVQGTLLGGNLIALLSLAGTPYFPKLKDTILVLEEVKEAPFHIDRMFNQLKQMGVFHQIKGLIIGDMSAKLTPYDKKVIQKIIFSYCKKLPYPVGFLKEYSHEKPEIILSIGGKVILDTQRGILTLDKIKKKK